MKKGLFWLLSAFFILAGLINLNNPAKAEQLAVAKDVVLSEKVSTLGDIDIEYGIKGYMRLSSYIRVKVEIKNAKKDFLGKVELKYYSVGGAFSSYSEDISLKKGESATVFFYPFINTVIPDFVVSFSDINGVEIEGYEDDISTGDVDETSEIAVATLVPTVDKLALHGVNNFRLKWIYINANQIEGDYRALNAFDLVILPDDYENKLSPEAVKILKEREREGGLSIEEKEIGEFNLSRLYLGKEDQSEWTWKVERVLSPILENLHINPFKYIIIILIYIIVVSPLTYFILAKRKRKVEYWIFVPVWAVIFTVIIYLISAESRIDGIFMNYVSVLDLREGRQNENVAFSVTNSSNVPYRLEINDGYTVESLYGSFSKPTDIITDKIKYNIENMDDGTDINVAEASAFDTLFLKSSGVPGIVAESAGTIYRDNTVIKGEFVNKLDVDLRYVFAVYDDEIVYIGDVLQGENRKFMAERGKVYLNELTGKLQDAVFINRIFGFDYEGENPKIQSFLTTILNRTSVLGAKQPAFVAVAADRLKGEFVSDVNKANGYTILILQATKEKDQGISSEKFVNSIGKLPMYLGVKSYSFTNDALANANFVNITYKVGTSSRIKSLKLLALYKEEINPCKVFILNQITGNYDYIFSPDEDYINKIKEYVESGGKTESEIENDQEFNLNSAYVKDGSITIRYEINQADYDEISAFTIPNIPKISMEYE